MDVLRSCYKTVMRFDSSQPDRLTPVQWFFTAAGAHTLGLPTAFCSRNYEPPGSDLGEIGEVQGQPRQWVNGAAPGVFSNTAFCGTADEFLNGISFMGPPDPIPFEVRPCCSTAVNTPCLDPIMWGGLAYVRWNDPTPRLVVLQFTGTEWDFLSGYIYMAWRCTPVSPPVLHQGLFAETVPVGSIQLAPYSWNAATMTSQYQSFGDFYIPDGTIVTVTQT